MGTALEGEEGGGGGGGGGALKRGGSKGCFLFISWLIGAFRLTLLFLSRQIWDAHRTAVKKAIAK